MPGVTLQWVEAAEVASSLLSPPHVALRTPTVLLLAALVAAAPAAQTDDTPLEPGAHALLFQIGPSLDLQSFSGGTISLKWHESETRARRLGLTLSADADFRDDDAEGFEPSRVENRQSVSARTGLLFLTYRRSRTPVYLYHGLGPVGGVSFDRIEQDLSGDLSGDTNGAIRTAVSADLGLGGAVGVEWVVAPAISLTGEYTTSLTGRYTRIHNSAQFFGEERESSADGFGLSLRPGGARLGLSVYF